MSQSSRFFQEPAVIIEPPVLYNYQSIMITSHYETSEIVYQGQISPPGIDPVNTHAPSIYISMVTRVTMFHYITQPVLGHVGPLLQ